MTRRRQLTFRLVLLISGLGGALLSGEATARLLGLAGWPVPGYYLGGKLTEGRVTGRAGGAYAPGVGHYVHYDYDVTWSVNGDGFRERERVGKQAGEWRIGLLGDSFVAGYGVQVTERFADVWFRSVRPRWEGATLWNFGSGPSGTGQQADLLGGVGGRYDLDEIVLAFYSGNDLEETIQGEAVGQTQAAGVALSRRDEMKAWLRENSVLATFLWFQGLRTLMSFRTQGYSSEEVSRLWAPTETALDRLRGLCGRRPLTIWYIPAVGEWDDPTWAVQRRKFGVDDQGRTAVRDRLAAWATTRGVPFLDTTPHLRGCSAAECLFRVDSHWTPLAHRLVGEGLARDPTSAWCLRRGDVHAGPPGGR